MSSSQTVNHFLALGILIFCYAVLTIGQVDIDYRCPGEFDCHCATLNATSDLVQAVCLVKTLETDIYNMSRIPGHLTTWLTFSCQWPMKGRTYGFEFQHLTVLEELQIFNCYMEKFADHTFEGLDNLKTLNMIGIVDPEINATLLQPLKSLTTLNMPENAYRELPNNFFCYLTNFNMTFILNATIRIFCCFLINKRIFNQLSMPVIFNE